MTARQLFEHALIETNKVQAPPLLLEDFNYYIMRAVYNFMTLRYNVDDMNQQVVDDLRVLKGTATLDVEKSQNAIHLHGATYIADLPRDYFHLLNCVVEYSVAKPFKCYSPSENVYFGASRLTSQTWGSVINNYYKRPTYRNPYFYIHNETEPELDVNPTPPDVPEKQANSRRGNPSIPKLEIRYGRDDSLFTLEKVHIDYYRVPKFILLTQTQIDMTEDTSQVLEFPDYVCHEITKELVKLLLEQSSDPRLQTNPIVNQVVAPPQPQQ